MVYVFRETSCHTASPVNCSCGLVMGSELFCSSDIVLHFMYYEKLACISNLLLKDIVFWILKCT